MRLFPLDADVFSFCFKQDTRADLYLPTIATGQPCVCFQTIAEIKAWAITRRWGAQRRAHLAEVLQHYVIFPYDPLMADHWARITAHRRQIGKEIACEDSWIAASGIRLDAMLLTHNRKDF